MSQATQELCQPPLFDGGIPAGATKIEDLHRAFLADGFEIFCTVIDAELVGEMKCPLATCAGPLLATGFRKQALGYRAFGWCPDCAEVRVEF